MPAMAPFHQTDSDPGTDALSRALNRTLSRYASVLAQVAHHYRLPPTDADEVLQDVRIRLWRALAESEKISAIPPSYVYRVAVSAALDLFRRRRVRRQETIERLEGRWPTRAPRPDQELEASELAKRLSQAIAMLPKERRVAVRLHLAGYHRDQIAGLLGWSEAKTRNLLYRGLATLRKSLNEEVTGSEGAQR